MATYGDRFDSTLETMLMKLGTHGVGKDAPDLLIVDGKLVSKGAESCEQK